jgi:hypothetical protein
VNEPDNLTAWVDGESNVWVRVDDAAARGGKNWHLLRGERLWLIESYRWDGFVHIAPFVRADAALAQMAVAAVRRQMVGAP